MRSLAILFFLSLTACATTPVTINQATAVPDSRILAPQLLAQAPNSGSLVVKRDSGFMGSACTVRVYVDAVPVADLGPSEKVEVFVALGEHSVVATPNGICGGGIRDTRRDYAQAANNLCIASGQARYFPSTERVRICCHTVSRPSLDCRPVRYGRPPVRHR
jgi:hypothetical protein